MFSTMSPSAFLSSRQVALDQLFHDNYLSIDMTAMEAEDFVAYMESTSAPFQEPTTNANAKRTAYAITLAEQCQFLPTLQRRARMLDFAEFISTEFLKNRSPSQFKDHANFPNFATFWPTNALCNDLRLEALRYATNLMRMYICTTTDYTHSGPHNSLFRSAFHLIAAFNLAGIAQSVLFNLEHAPPHNEIVQAAYDMLLFFAATANVLPDYLMETFDSEVTLQPGVSISLPRSPRSWSTLAWNFLTGHYEPQSLQDSAALLIAKKFDLPMQLPRRLRDRVILFKNLPEFGNLKLSDNGLNPLEAYAESLWNALRTAPAPPTVDLTIDGEACGKSKKRPQQMEPESEDGIENLSEETPFEPPQLQFDRSSKQLTDQQNAAEWASNLRAANRVRSTSTSDDDDVTSYQSVPGSPKQTMWEWIKEQLYHPITALTTSKDWIMSKIRDFSSMIYDKVASVLDSLLDLMPDAISSPIRTVNAKVRSFLSLITEKIVAMAESAKQQISKITGWMGRVGLALLILVFILLATLGIVKLDFVRNMLSTGFAFVGISVPCFLTPPSVLTRSLEDTPSLVDLRSWVAKLLTTDCDPSQETAAARSICNSAYRDDPETASEILNEYITLGTAAKNSRINILLATLAHAAPAPLHDSAQASAMLAAQNPTGTNTRYEWLKNAVRSPKNYLRAENSAALLRTVTTGILKPGTAAGPTLGFGAMIIGLVSMLISSNSTTFGLSNLSSFSRNSLSALAFAGATTSIVEFGTRLLPFTVVQSFRNLVNRYSGGSTDSLFEWCESLKHFTNAPDLARFDEFKADLEKNQTALLELLSHPDATVRKTANSYYAFFSLYLVSISHKDHAAPIRPEPYVIRLIGNPGCGKTTSVNMITSTLGYSNSVYVRNSNDPFWTGLDKTVKCIFFDEFSTFETAAEQASWLTLCSSSIYRPVMAALNDKGVAIEPELIIAAGNTPYPLASNQAAVDRRTNLLLECRVATEYDDGSGKVDPVKMTSTFSRPSLAATIPWMHFRVLPSDSRLAGTSNSAWLTWPSICSHAKTQIERNLKVCVQMRSLMQKTVTATSLDTYITARNAFIDRSTGVACAGPQETAFIQACARICPIDLNPRITTNRSWNMEVNTYTALVADLKTHYINCFTPNHDPTACSECKNLLAAIKTSCPTLTAVAPTPTRGKGTPVQPATALELDACTLTSAVPPSQVRPLSEISPLSFDTGSLDLMSWSAALVAVAASLALLVAGFRKMFGPSLTIDMSCGQATSADYQSETLDPYVATGQDLSYGYANSSPTISNIIELSTPNNTIHGTVFRMQVDGVLKTYVITTAHLFSKNDPETGSIVLDRDCNLTINWTSLENKNLSLTRPAMSIPIAHCLEKDLIMFICPAEVERTLHIKKLRFIPVSEIVSGSQCVEQFTRKGTNQHTACLSFTPWTYQSDQQVAVHMPTYWVYNIAGADTRGMCGLPLISKHVTHTNVILGIHVAQTGTRAHGISVPLDLHLVKTLVSHLNTPEIDLGGPGIASSSPVCQPYFMCEKSKLMPSHLNLPRKTERIIVDLSARQVPDLVENCLTISQGVPELSSLQLIDLTAAASGLTAKLLTITTDAPNRPLTITESILGCPGSYDGINKISGPGYPYVHYGLSKSDLFDSLTGAITNNMFLKRLSTLLQTIEKGTPVPCRMLTYLKDELRAPGKAPRLIYAPPVDFTTATNVYLGPLKAALCSGWSATRCEIFIGADPSSNDIAHPELLARARFGTTPNAKIWFDGDFKNFDFKLHHDIQRRAFAICSELGNHLLNGNFGTKNYKPIFDAIFSSILHCETQYGPSVYDEHKVVKFHHGQRSGNPMTTPLNSICGALMIRMAFNRLCPGAVFEDNVLNVHHGDDLLIAVRPALHSEFNAVTLASYMHTLGLVMTYGDKRPILQRTQSPPEWKEYTEITILGRHPIPVHGNMFVGALRKSTLESLPCWRRRGIPLELMLEVFFRECALWGVDYQQHWISYLAPLAGRDVLLRVLSRLPSADQLIQLALDRSTFKFNQAAGLTSQSTPLTNLKMLGPSTTTSSQDKAVAVVAHTINEPPIELESGKSSWIHRETHTVAMNTAGATELASYLIPKDFITAIPSWKTNLQDVPFQQFLLQRPNGTAFMEVKIIVNGNSFCSGQVNTSYLVTNGAPFTSVFPTTDPRCHSPTEFRIQDLSSPSESIIKIPFTQGRDYINSIASTENDENLGTLVIHTISPSGPPTSKLTVTVWTKYTISSALLYPRLDPDLKQFDQRIGRACGGGHSTHVTETYVTYEDCTVVGSPASTNTDYSQQSAEGAQVDADLSVPIPMHTQPIVGGAIPMVITAQDSAQCFGPVVCRILGTENPQEARLDMHRDFRVSADALNITQIMARPHYHSTIQLPTSTVAGSTLVEFELAMPLSPSDGFMPVLLSRMLKRYAHWTCDSFEIELRAFMPATNTFAVRTVFTPVSPLPVAFAEASTQYNDFCQFGSGNRTQKFSVPWSAATSWLKVINMERTLDLAADPVQNFSLGWISVFLEQSVQTPSITDLGTTSIDVYYKVNGLKFGTPTYNPLWDRRSPATGVTDGLRVLFAFYPTAADLDAPGVACSGETEPPPSEDVPATPITGAPAQHMESISPLHLAPCEPVPFEIMTLTTAGRRMIPATPVRTGTFRAKTRSHFPTPIARQTASSFTGETITVTGADFTTFTWFAYSTDLPVPAMMARGGVNFLVNTAANVNRNNFAFCCLSNPGPFKKSDVWPDLAIVSDIAATGQFYFIKMTLPPLYGDATASFVGGPDATPNSAPITLLDPMPSQLLLPNGTNTFRVVDNDIKRWHTPNLNTTNDPRLFVVVLSPLVQATVLAAFSDDFRAAGVPPDQPTPTPNNFINDVYNYPGSFREPVVLNGNLIFSP